MTLEKRFQVGHSVSFTHIYIIYHSSDSSGSYIYIYIHIYLNLIQFATKNGHVEDEPSRNLAFKF